LLSNAFAPITEVRAPIFLDEMATVVATQGKNKQPRREKKIFLGDAPTVAFTLGARKAVQQRNILLLESDSDTDSVEGGFHIEHHKSWRRQLPFAGTRSWEGLGVAPDAGGCGGGGGIAPICRTDLRGGMGVWHGGLYPEKQIYRRGNLYSRILPPPGVVI
jgi:hypothetical protein